MIGNPGKFAHTFAHHHWITNNHVVDVGMHCPDPRLKNEEPTPSQCWECSGAEGLSYQPVQALCQLKRAQCHASILVSVHPMTLQPGGTRAWPFESNSTILNGHVRSRLSMELTSILCPILLPLLSFHGFWSHEHFPIIFLPASLFISEPALWETQNVNSYFILF